MAKLIAQDLQPMLEAPGEAWAAGGGGGPPGELGGGLGGRGRESPQEAGDGKAKIGGFERTEGGRVGNRTENR